MDIENGKINLTEMLNEHIASFCMSTFCSDVNLIIEDKKIPAHRFILAARCEYFQELFFTDSNAQYKNEFKLKVPIKPFQIILQYFYTGQLILSDIIEIEIIFQTYDLINKMDLFELKEYFEIYLNGILSMENIFNMLEKTRFYKLHLLEIKCLNFIDNKSNEILTNEKFRNISKELLEEILTRDTFCKKEILIFNAVNEWCKHKNENIENVIDLVNLHLIPFKELLKIRKLGILSADKIFDAIEKQIPEESFVLLDIPEPNINVHTTEECNLQSDLNSTNIPEDINIKKVKKDDIKIKTIDQHDFQFKLIKGEIKCSYPLNAKNGYTRHIITEKNDSGLIIELDKVSLLNHIEMLLWDHDKRTYSYFIEGSIDQKNWERIIDYSAYRCRSYQNLYFQEENFKYIKIVGTFCSESYYFDIVTLKVEYKNFIPQLTNGFLVPEQNVALVKMGAMVIEGRGDPNKNNLINGEYDENSGYTWHNIGSEFNESILIRLSQPYIIGSVRLLLNKQNNRMYKFYIETSVNKRDWDLVADKRNEFVTSWHTFSFSSRPVIYIRIVGTEYNNRFMNSMMVNYFECPADNFLCIKTNE